MRSSRVRRVKRTARKSIKARKSISKARSRMARRRQSKRGKGTKKRSLVKELSETLSLPDLSSVLEYPKNKKGDRPVILVDSDSVSAQKKSKKKSKKKKKSKAWSAKIHGKGTKGKKGKKKHKKKHKKKMKGGGDKILTIDKVSTQTGLTGKSSHKLSEFTAYREKGGDIQFLSLGDTTGSPVYGRPGNLLSGETHLAQRIGELGPTFINLSNGDKAEVVSSEL